jgi:Cu+-exporting ATPase
MTEANATAHDPVCHMDIQLANARGISDHDGKTYYFCSGGCKAEFDSDPAAVLKAEAQYDHSKGPSMH